MRGNHDNAGDPWLAMRCSRGAEIDGFTTVGERLHRGGMATLWSVTRWHRRAVADEGASQATSDGAADQPANEAAVTPPGLF
ncbi:hypothetical protein [Bradyrhizobium genosp. P]|uniref:hypothetical protein n=1 Tax=Bradyrhizobium genosp. P TaxID=83641 RepID=UPI003CF19BD7